MVEVGYENPNNGWAFAAPNDLNYARKSLAATAINEAKPP